VGSEDLHRQLLEQLAGGAPAPIAGPSRTQPGGIVLTWVLRMVRRRQWNWPPKGKVTGRAPYQELTSVVPSCASSGRAAASAAGSPLNLDQECYPGSRQSPISAG
jgi:hypothetical protein